MTLAEPIAVTLEVTAALDKLGVVYLVGGSFASSVHGIPRSTQDVGLLVELTQQAVDALVAELAPRFYIDADMIRDAITRRASFNIIHLATMFKVDMFVSSGSPLLREEMSRRQPFDLGEPARRVYVCSPEDIVVQKLFQKGNRTSEPWDDVLGVLKVRRGSLDLDYLRRCAAVLEVSALLERALGESDARPA